jgi:hypothetical protein
MATDKEITKPTTNKIKKTRLLLDPRTELTDKELKVRTSLVVFSLF